MACRNIKHKSGAQPSEAERVTCRRQEVAKPGSVNHGVNKEPSERHEEREVKRIMV